MRITIRYIWVIFEQNVPKPHFGKTPTVPATLQKLSFWPFTPMDAYGGPKTHLREISKSQKVTFALCQPRFTQVALLCQLCFDSGRVRLRQVKKGIVQPRNSGDTALMWGISIWPFFVSSESHESQGNHACRRGWGGFIV